MAETPAKVPIGRRNSGEVGKYSDEPESMGVMIFGFLEENEESQESSCHSGDSFDGEDFVDDNGEEEEDENSSNVQEDKAFWETQGQLLEAILRRRSSFESKIKQAVKDAMKKLNSEGFGCICRRPVNDCRNCKQREISSRLQIVGFNCSICKSKWKSSPEIPSGEHTYLEVLMDSSSSSPKRSSGGGETRVVIELNFKAEFEMARASQEYHHLIHQLPEIFVGKSERLKALIKILCSAAKKCMKDQKMHMAPWRKQKYMQAKWVGKSEQKMLSPFLPINNSHLDRPPKQKASMLTFDLLEINNFATMRCTAVKVV